MQSIYIILEILSGFMDKSLMLYQRIMVAVDGNETAELALKEACQLTKALHSQPLAWDYKT